MVDDDFLKAKMREMQQEHQNVLQNAFRLEGAINFCTYLLAQKEEADKETEDGTNRPGD